ncbi:MAG: helix-turn-helix domain-containing protein [Candidatus Latescibacteria bacterium]|nr:helix-turn-helix domain-containing protein [Candidatus Latescibacterota bacterium]
MTQIKTQLRVLLAQRNMKQYQLAQAAGIRPNTVTAIINDDWDRISRDVMLKICKVLDCQPGDLFVRE